jgi:hypothetical protein
MMVVLSSSRASASARDAQNKATALPYRALYRHTSTHHLKPILDESQTQARPTLWCELLSLIKTLTDV